MGLQRTSSSPICVVISDTISDNTWLNRDIPDSEGQLRSIVRKLERLNRIRAPEQHHMLY